MNKEEYSCSVISAGAAVDFNTSIDLYKLFKESSYNKWIPEMTVLRGSLNCGYRVSFCDSEDRTIEFEEKNVRINYPWEMMQRGESILYAGYPLIELQHQQNQSATIHAACVELNNQGILFLGESGSGKTTLATKLCCNYGAKLFSNDLAIIGLDDQGLYCLGGTKFYQFRRESVSRSLPGFIKLFTDSLEDSWSQKIIINASDIGVNVGEGKTRLNHIYKIHVDEGKNILTVRSADNLSTRLNLNENLTRYIRNSVTVIIGGKNNEFLGYIPSLDRPEFFDWRKKTIELIMEEKKSLYLSGSSDEMVNLIVKNCV